MVATAISRSTPHLAALAGLTLLSFVARAQSDAAPPDPYSTIPLAPSSEAVTEAKPRPSAESSSHIEEIVVTAQKREQRIQDVPISMSVVDQKFVANWAVTDVREAMLAVPNVKVEEAGFFASPRVRGFSFNNNNKAFEPPAGVALDGIPYTRVEYFNAAIFDIKRVEVLRGPQGTTFGKNTTAGLIHILTSDPTEVFEGHVDLQAGDYGRRRAEAAFGGPLIGEDVQFRIAGFVEERDGFMRNTTAAVSAVAAEELRGVDRHGLRAKLRFVDVAGADLKLSAEAVRLGSLGAGAELFNASPDVQAVLRRYDPNTDFIKGNYVASIDEPDARRAEIDTFAAEGTRSFGDWNLVGIAGHSVLRNHVMVDADFTPAPAVYGEDHDRSPTSTLELRAESPRFEGLFGLCAARCGDSSFLAGVYAQDRRIEGPGFLFRIGTVPFLELTLASRQDEPWQGFLDQVPPELRAQLFSAVPLTPAGSSAAAEEVQQGFKQDAQALALFGQVDWSFAERWGLQLGLRLNREKKQAHWNSRYRRGAPNPVLRLAGISEFTAERELSETQLTPKISVDYRLGEDTRVFVHYARAYKGGGFNAFAFRGVDDELVYDPEIAHEWGVDVKSVLRDGRLRANLSLYRLDINDFQVLTRVPDVMTVGLGVTKVENAATARSQGVEADLTWLPDPRLALTAALGINDTEYLDFRTNDCPADRDNTDGDGDRRCDATGKPFAFAPRINGSLLGNLRLPLGTSGLEFSAGAAVAYTSEQYLDIDLDDRKTQEAFTRYKGSIGIANPGRGWSFKLLGENLTNERTSIRQGDVVPGLFVNLQEAPRMIFGQFRWTL